VSAAPLKLAVAAVAAVAAFVAPKSVKAGKALTALMAATRSDTGNLVGKEGRVQCRATIGGKSLRLLASITRGLTSAGDSRPPSSNDDGERVGRDRWVTSCLPTRLTQAALAGA